jgi:hypothetical protein
VKVLCEMMVRQLKTQNTIDLIEQNQTGGRGGIRTHGSLATTPDFESGAFNHSATLPTVVTSYADIVCLVFYPRQVHSSAIAIRSEPGYFSMRKPGLWY